MIPLQEALEHLDREAAPLELETVGLQASVGRFLTSPVTADIDSPPYDKSVMDGFAIRSADWEDSQSVFDVVDTIVAGDTPQAKLGPRQASRVMTGAPLPDGADAVVMIELAHACDGLPLSDCRQVKFELEQIQPEQHLLRKSANFAAATTLFATGHRVRTTDIGLMAEVGVTELRLSRRPRVAVLPTGNELVDASIRPGPGQIRNSNGPMLLGMLREEPVELVPDLGIARDTPEDLESRIRSALDQADVLILTGGVSMGQLDLVPGILSQLGVAEVFHRIRMKPGKPVWFGIQRRPQGVRYVFGLPGNPVSSLVGYQLLVRTLLNRLLGGALQPGPRYRLPLTKHHQTRGNRPTYWPGRLAVDSSRLPGLEPLRWNGSSDLLALGRADGLIHFPEDRHDYDAGDLLEWIPFH